MIATLAGFGLVLNAHAQVHELTRWRAGRAGRRTGGMGIASCLSCPSRPSRQSVPGVR
jgi:hypothetical protein